MKSLVLVKQVPDTKEIKTDEETGSLKRDTVGSVINEADIDALIMCKNLKEERNISFDAMTLGPVQSRAALRQALGYGAENAYHVCDGDFAGSDVLATAKTLKSAIDFTESEFSIIFTGFKSTDSDTGHLPAELATLLGYTYITGVTKINEITDDYINLVSVSDNKILNLKVKLPVVISTKQNNYPLQLPNLRQMMIARKKPLQKITNEDLRFEKKDVGYFGSPTKFVKMRATVSDRKNQFLTDFNPKTGLPKLLQTAESEIKSEKRNYFNLNKRQRVLVVSDKKDLDVSKQMASSLNVKPEFLDLTLITNTKKVEQLKSYFDKIIISEKSEIYDQMAVFVTDYIKNNEFDIMLSDSNDFGRCLSATVAANLKTGLTADCTEFDFQDDAFIMTRPAYDDRLLASIKVPDHLPQMATVRPDIFEVCDLNKNATIIENSREVSKSKIEILKSEDCGATKEETKDLLFLVGNILTSKEEVEYFENLAKKYDADLACTRPLVTGQLMPHEKQVGVSGYISKAKLAVLIGVSGTTQTMTGLKRCNKILAINIDENAEVFNYSDYGIVDDYKNIFK